MADCRFGTGEWYCVLRAGHEGPHHSGPFQPEHFAAPVPSAPPSPGETPEAKPEPFEEWLKSDNGFPRANRVDLWTQAERAIQDAVDVCETTLPADVLETDAIILLGKAREKVARLVDREIRAGRMAMPEPYPACGRVASVGGVWRTCTLSARHIGQPCRYATEECADECGNPRASKCVGCVEAEYQGAHPDCATCCPPLSASETHTATPETLLARVIRCADGLGLPCAEVVFDVVDGEWNVDWSIDRGNTLAVVIESTGSLYWAALIGTKRPHGHSASELDASLATIRDILAKMVAYAASAPSPTTPEVPELQ